MYWQFGLLGFCFGVPQHGCWLAWAKICLFRCLHCDCGFGLMVGFWWRFIWQCYLLVLGLGYACGCLVVVGGFIRLSLLLWWLVFVCFGWLWLFNGVVLRVWVLIAVGFGLWFGLACRAWGV